MFILCLRLFSGSGNFPADIKFTGLEKNFKKKKKIQLFTPFLDKNKRPIRQMDTYTFFSKFPTPSFSEYFFEIHRSHKLKFSINNLSFSLAQWGENYTQKCRTSQNQSQLLVTNEQTTSHSRGRGPVITPTK